MNLILVGKSLKFMVEIAAYVESRIKSNHNFINQISNSH